jgi:hypothetical protein
MPSTANPWDKFLEVEHSLGLEEWEHEGIKIWKLLRDPLWQEYLQLLEGKSPKMYKRKPQYKRVIFYGLNILLANPFLVFQRKKRLILAHDREILVDGIPSDPTSSRALSGTPESENMILFTSPGSWAHYKAGQKSNFLPHELGILLSKCFGFGRAQVDMKIVEAIIENLFALLTDEDTRKLLSKKLARRVKEEAKKLLHTDIKLDYLEIVDAASFEPVNDDYSGSTLALFAGYVGDVRLIDNREISIKGS